MRWIIRQSLRFRFLVIAAATALMIFGAGLVFLGLQLVLMGLLGEMIASQRARSDYPVRRAYPADVA